MRGALTVAALNWTRRDNKWPRTHHTRFWIVLVIYGSVVVVAIIVVIAIVAVHASAPRFAFCHAETVIAVARHWLCYLRCWHVFDLCAFGTFKGVVVLFNGFQAGAL